MEDKSRAHIIISGRVQGVFFRANTARAGERLGVSGWVRNLPDGTVEAVIEGNADAVREMVQWCHTGDPPARVDGVRISWQPYTAEFRGFRVTY